MDRIVSLARRRGFVFPSSEIYGGLGSSYDYGHYGVLLKENVKARWLEAMVQERDDIVALDSAIILHPSIWDASGTSRASPIRWSTAASARSASARITSQRSNAASGRASIRAKRPTATSRRHASSTSCSRPGSARSRGRVRGSFCVPRRPRASSSTSCCGRLRWDEAAVDGVGFQANLNVGPNPDPPPAVLDNVNPRRHRGGVAARAGSRIPRAAPLPGPLMRRTSPSVRLSAGRGWAKGSGPN